jgi:hypothetical protein
MLSWGFLGILREVGWHPVESGVIGGELKGFRTIFLK